MTLTQQRPTPPGPRSPRPPQTVPATSQPSRIELL